MCLNCSTAPLNRSTIKVYDLGILSLTTLYQNKTLHNIDIFQIHSNILSSLLIGYYIFCTTNIFAHQ